MPQPGDLAARPSGAVTIRRGGHRWGITQYAGGIIVGPTSNLIGGLIVLAAVVYAALRWRRRSPTAGTQANKPGQFAEYLATDQPGRQRRRGASQGTSRGDPASTQSDSRAECHNAGPGPRATADPRIPQDAGLPGGDLAPPPDEDIRNRPDRNARRES